MADNTTNTILAEVEQPVVGNTGFGFGQMGKPTPMWAKWIFNVLFLITTAVAFIVASDPGITANIKVRIILYLKGFDIIIYGLAHMFGIEAENPNK